MVDNSIALNVKPFGEQQYNPVNMLLAAAQLRQSDNQNDLTRVNIEAAQRNLLQQTQEYRAAQVGKAAGEVLDAPEAQRPVLMKQKLDELHAAKILDDAAYQRALSNPPDQQTLTSLYMRGLTIEQQIALRQKESDRQMGRTIMQQLAPAMGAGEITPPVGAGRITPGAATIGPGPAAPQKLEGSGNYWNTLFGRESGGNPAATPKLPDGSPASTAAGISQITAGTWGDLAARNPDAGLTEDGRVGTSKDAIEQQKQATKLLTADNAAKLSEAKILPNDKNLYVAHFLGAGGAVKFLNGMKENPTAPATSLVNQDAVKANPAVFLDSDGKAKTAAGVYNSLTRPFYAGSSINFAMPSDLPTSADPEAARMAQALPKLRLLRMAPGIPDSVAKGIDETIKHYEKATEPTNEIKNYNLYAAQERSAGRVPVSFDKWGEQNTTEMKNAQSAGYSSPIDYESAMATGKKVGEAMGEAPAETIKTAQLAPKRIQQLDTIKDALVKGNGSITTGPFAEYALKAKQAASSLFGIDMAGVPEAEIAQKMGFGLATTAVKELTSRGTQMEFSRALQANPGLLMSPKGSMLMIDILKQTAHQDMDLAKMAQDKKNWGDWQGTVDKYYKDHPIISPLTGKPVGEADAKELGVTAAQASSAPVGDGATATNPKTGETLIKKDGKWVPLT